MSLMMAGFGQYYNGQYIFGTLILLIEFVTNGFAGLNMAIMHSFHGQTQTAHDIFNHQWGLFYPSVYGKT